VAIRVKQAYKNATVLIDPHSPRLCVDFNERVNAFTTDRARTPCSDIKGRHTAEMRACA